MARAKRLGRESFQDDEFPSPEQLPNIDFGSSLSLIQPSNRTPFEVLGHLESEAIAIIGYQLWTPLSAIQVCLELLELPEDGEPGARQSMLELALQEMAGLEELIRECLALFSPTEPVVLDK